MCADVELQDFNQNNYAQMDVQEKKDIQVTYFGLIKVALRFTIKDIQSIATAQYDDFRKVYVNELKWVKPSHYDQTIQLIETIPGSTTTQIVVALSTIAKKNAFGGILSIFFFSLPSAAILLTSGLLLRGKELRELNVFLFLALQGIRASSVALISHICLKLIYDHVVSRLEISIVIISAVLFRLYPFPETLITLLALGGALMVMLEYDKQQKPKTDSPQQTRLQASVEDLDAQDYDDQITTKNANQYSFILGSKSLHVYYIILLALLWFLRVEEEDDIEQSYHYFWTLCVSFYKIGSLIFGGTPITLAFMYAEITSHQTQISEDAMWIGFALAAACPGPYLNFAIFLGAHTYGPLGGIGAWIAIFIPSILQIWGLLPYWRYLSKSRYFKGIREGFNCVSIGFLLIAIFEAWQNAGRFDMQTSTIITVLSLLYIVMLNFNSPSVILFGAGLFICRYLALWYYRLIPTMKP